MTQHTPALAAVHVGSTSFVAFALVRGDLTDDGATPWYATVGLGTPPQPLRFMLDTGTTNTWITDSRCTTDACKAHSAFDAQQSSTFVASHHGSHTVDFGPWGTMTVELGCDVCHLYREANGEQASVPLNEPMSIYLATNYEGSQFTQLDCDGGCAIPAIRWKSPSALMEQLWLQGLIQRPLASFYFHAEQRKGSCLMGALDPRRFDPHTVNLLPVTPLDGSLSYLWTVKLSDLACGGKSLGTDLDLALDTGSSVFKGSCAMIQPMLAAITRGGTLPTVVSSPDLLSDYPDLTLTLGNRIYTLTPQQYFMQEEADHRWHLGVRCLDGLPDGLLVVGAVFLDTVYSAFFFEGGGGVFTEPTVMLAAPVRSALSGKWKNQFGSIVEIGPVAADGTFTGTYTSSTGATGVYPLVGVTDPAPEGHSIPVSFSVSWRSKEGRPDPSWHWVSGFTGLLQTIGGVETITTTYLLQQNATASAPDWMATAVYTSVFKRVTP